MKELALLREKFILGLLALLCILWLLCGCTKAVSPSSELAARGLDPTRETPAALSKPMQKLILATTTSTRDSGLLQFILPDFEQQYHARVDVIAVGTGQAMKLGEDGNADVLLVHDPAQEEEFMKSGHGIRREDVMYNDFVIVGPASDPADIKGLASAAEAFQRIAQAQATFISRGDESGTHAKERSIWKKAGISPQGTWYVSAGQGMGAILTMAEEMQAYTLSDRATYLARKLKSLDLEIWVEGDPILFNPYGVIAVNPAKNKKINAELANAFLDWIVSEPVQAKIASFGKDQFGQSLFIPDSALWRAAHPTPVQQ